MIKSALVLVSVCLGSAIAISGCNSGTKTDAQGTAAGSGAASKLVGTWVQTNAPRGQSIIWQYDADGHYSATMEGKKDPHLGDYTIAVKGSYTEGEGKITQQATSRTSRATNPEGQKVLDATVNRQASKGDKLSGTTTWLDDDHVTIDIVQPGTQKFVLRRKAVVQ